MSLGGGASSSSSRAFPSWARPYEVGVMKEGQGLMNQFIDQGGNQNPYSQQGTAELQKTVSGAYLDPATDPTLQPTADAIKSNSLDSYSKMAQQINQGAQGSGMLLSSANNAQLDNTARGVNKDVTNQLAQLYGGAYQTARGQQLQSIAPLMQQGQLPYDQALQIAQMLGGMGSSKGSSMNVSI